MTTIISFQWNSLYLPTQPNPCLHSLLKRTLFIVIWVFDEAPTESLLLVGRIIMLRCIIQMIKLWRTLEWGPSLVSLAVRNDTKLG